MKISKMRMGFLIIILLLITLGCSYSSSLIERVRQKKNEQSISISEGEAPEEAGTAITPPSSPSTLSPSETPFGYFKLHAPGEYTKAALTFLYDQATSELEGGYVPRLCTPGRAYTGDGDRSSFGISSDGSMAGECLTSIKDNTSRSDELGKLTGTWVKDGKVSFTLESTSFTEGIAYEGSAKVIVTYISTSGQFVAENLATGSAEWEAVCQSWTKNIICGPHSDDSYTWGGTIPWEITFYP